MRITDNGGGTVTVRQISPARVVVLGPDGRTVSHFSALDTHDLLVDQAGTPSDPTYDELLAVLGSTSHGRFDAPGLCELARRQAP